MPIKRALSIILPAFVEMNLRRLIIMLIRTRPRERERGELFRGHKSPFRRAFVSAGPN